MMKFLKITAFATRDWLLVVAASEAVRCSAMELT